MKVRKLLVMVVALTFVFGTAVFAESISQGIKIELNKKDLDGGLLVDNKAYIGVGALSSALQALVSWDNDAKKAVINKPNVHMFVMNGSNSFGIIDKGTRLKFQVYAQIDSLYTDITAFKITITTPYGDETLIDGRNSSDDDFKKIIVGKDNFIFTTTKDFSYQFSYAGPYTIRFWMQPSGASQMQVVSEKVISSMTR